ncbi:hypothetical protein DFP72DRAFT_608905 [Ephemerocybe angulata]|uniref:BTB domain-containing protein n=1 Tax=Ephemerocybe angulata TaxID=980116 RepID=A0A8H6HJ93_9AGAR|nr:hypothetical protein DFP72DRAFT_608905 [Tulosesus angulatus]
MTAITEPACEKDEVYYWPNNVRFLVEGKLFRVSQYQFISGSRYFSEKYGLSNTADDDGPESVVQLPNVVSAAQFRVFLKMLFPVHTTSTTSSFTKDEWLTILELSVLWHFHDLRKLAIQHLDGNLTDVELIKVGRAAYVPQWVLAGYKALVVRQGIITEDEGDEIGNRTVNTLWIIRYLVEHRDLEGDLKKEIESRFSGEIAALGVAEFDHTILEIETSLAEEQRPLEDDRRLSAREEDHEREGVPEVEAVNEQERAGTASPVPDASVEVAAVELGRERVEDVTCPQLTFSSHEVGGIPEKLHSLNDVSPVRTPEEVVNRLGVECDGGTKADTATLEEVEVKLTMEEIAEAIESLDPGLNATKVNMEPPGTGGNRGAEIAPEGTIDHRSIADNRTSQVGDHSRSEELGPVKKKKKKKKRALFEAKEAKIQEELLQVQVEEEKRQAEFKDEEGMNEGEQRREIEAKADVEGAKGEGDSEGASFWTQGRQTSFRPFVPPPLHPAWDKANSRPSFPGISRPPEVSAGRLHLYAKRACDWDLEDRSKGNRGWGFEDHLKVKSGWDSD